MAKIEIVNATDGDWRLVFIDGELWYEHHQYDSIWPILLAKLGNEVIEYDQPLDEDGWLDKTVDQREVVQIYTGEEDLY